MRVIGVDHMVWGAMLGARNLFLLLTSASASLERRERYHRFPPCITRSNYVNHLGTWNVRGINDTTKREEVLDIFKKGKFELPALTETKLKGKGAVSWCGINGIIFVFMRWKELGKGWPSY